MAGKKNKREARRLADTLPGVMRDRGWETKLDQHSIFPRWAEIVDAETATHSAPLKIVRGTLWVEVENSVWLQQLQFQKHLLLQALNDELKKSRLQDIRFTLPEGRAPQPPAPERKLRFVPPPAEEVESFRSQASFIEDEASREALTRLWYLSRACRQEVQQSEEEPEKNGNLLPPKPGI